jgi:hypothetical protein
VFIGMTVSTVLCVVLMYVPSRVLVLTYWTTRNPVLFGTVPPPTRVNFVTKFGLGGSNRWTHPTVGKGGACRRRCCLDSHLTHMSSALSAS